LVQGLLGFSKSARVLAVGDLHIASFGTWRDGFGRLIWGVDDFDDPNEFSEASEIYLLILSTALRTTS